MLSRLKERGGGGGKVMATKPGKTLDPSPPVKDKSKPSSTRRTPFTAVKENLRSLSAGRRRDPSPKPADNRPNAAAVAGVRRSTSSVPKSRAPSNPSDFSRLVSTLRGDRIVPRVSSSTDRFGRGITKDLEAEAAQRKSSAGGKFLEKFGKGKEGKLLSAGSTKVLQKCNAKNGAHGFAISDKKEVLDAKELDTAAPEKINSEISNNTKDEQNNKNGILVPCKVSPEKSVSNVESGLIGKGENEIKVYNVVVLDSVSDNRECTQIANRYPSKLHEKLAILEGRVQKIASEIRRTKEILDDNNNPDESKLILSEIQSKISSVEKAVTHMAIDTGNNDNKIQIGKPGYNKASSSKGLNQAQLEERFFPHHKLLRNHRSNLNRLDENIQKRIEMEFLSSLDATESEISNTAECSSKHMATGFPDREIELCADEKIEEFDVQEINKYGMVVQEEIEEVCTDQLKGIGSKIANCGWFVSEGEAVLLAHADGTCSYYDIVNCEGKGEYKPPVSLPQNIWGDIWLIRAPGLDGCSGRYVVAASAGSNTTRSGFCSWDFYKRDVAAFNVDQEDTSGPVTERRTCWYRPCGPLLLSSTCRQRRVTAYDIRDGDEVMKWEVNIPVAAMEFSSPVQWRSRGKVVISGNETVSLWDVNSLGPQPLLTIGLAGKRLCSLLVNNTDAELSGGVRQRVSSSDAEGNDGVFSTQESVSILDFRSPSGTGLKIPRQSAMSANSIFSRGDSVFIGSTESRLQIKGTKKSNIQQFSIRKGKLVSTYELPEINNNNNNNNNNWEQCVVSQVWGSSDLVMGLSGKGLFVFNGFREDGHVVGVRESVGPDGMVGPTFDYAGSRVLLVSRDRPALWRYLS